MRYFLLLLCVLLAIRLSFFYLTSQPPKETKKHEQAPIFRNIKGNIDSTYRKYLSSDQAGLLMGIVFGEKSLSYEANEKFRTTGVLHVVAASGMNVSMLVSFLLATLIIFVKKQYALGITIFAVIFYTALADFQPSIVRAAIMGTIALGASLFGRQNTSLLALFFAAFGMIMLDPSIITSISFQLSFAATLGIVLIDPLFKTYISKSEVLEDFRTTLAAQIATTPIILFFFATYSPVSIPVNLLILWTVPPLMVLGGIAAIASFISPVISAPFVYLCLPLLSYFLTVIDVFNKFSLNFNIEHIPWSVIVGYYLILLAIIIKLNNIQSENIK